MDKLNKVSDKAKTNLLRQQIALLDMIEESTRGNEGGWESYFESVVPEVHFDEEMDYRSHTNISVHYMKEFRDSVYLGVTPSALLLSHIARLFDKYLSDKSGTLTLDEAFNLKQKSRVGNPIKQERWLQKKLIVLLAIGIQKKLSELKGNKISIEAAAGIVINEWNLSASEESLKKEYKKFGIEGSYKEGYYPPTQECIRDLEKAFRDATELYCSDIIPKQRSTIDRMNRKQTIKDILSMLIELLGKN